MRNSNAYPNILSRPIATVIAAQAIVGLCAMISSGSRALAEESDTRVSSLSYKQTADPKSFLAFPAISVPSGAFGSSYSPPPPTPRSMPTSLSTQGWSSAGTASVSAPAATYTPPPSTTAQVSASGGTAATTQGESRAPGAVRSTVSEEAAATPPAGTGGGGGRARGKVHAPETPARHAEAAAAPGEAPAPKAKPRFRTGAVAAQERPSRPAPAEPAPGGASEKEIIPAAATAPLFRVSGSAGYYSRYMFRGLDVAYRTGIDKGNDSGFAATNANVSIGDFTLGFWYEHSLDSYVPGGAGFDKSFGNPNDPFQFKTPSRERYQEYDLFANYTFHLMPDLALTAGMNFYWFSDGRFWANSDSHVNHTVEAAASLNYTGIPFLNQTLSYYYDFDAFKGGYLEYKVATKPFELFHSGDFAIGIIPSVPVAYDFRYNGSDNGWNHIEPGVDIPIRLSEGLTLNLGARYSFDLGDSSEGGNGQAVDRTDDRFWFSAAFQYAFPNGPSELPAMSKEIDGKSIMEKNVVPEEDHKWRLSVGAGVRTVRTGFEFDPAPAWEWTRKPGGGDLFIATRGQDARYIDGEVYSKTGTQFNDGTSEFSFSNQSQLTRNGPFLNRQLTFHSDRYEYDARSHGADAAHDDPAVYPYIDLSRELLDLGPLALSVGLRYEYTRSESDSGFQILSRSSEVKTTHNFTYDMDEIFSWPSEYPIAPFNNFQASFRPDTNNSRYNYTVIHNSKQYQNRYGGNALAGIGAPFIVIPTAPPQHTQDVLTREVAAIRGSTVETDLHTASIPIDLKYDLTRKIHARLSFGPSFNVFDTDLQTDTYYQLIETFVPEVPVKTRSPYNVANAYPVNLSPSNAAAEAFLAGGAAGAGAQFGGGTGSGKSVASQQQASSGGGKGSQEGQSRKLPGKTMRHTVNSANGQEFKLGVFGQASLEVDLDARNRWFIELYARYDYVPSFTITDDVTTSSIDASSWGGGIGLGFRF